MARRSLQDIALNGGSLFSDILNFNEFGTTNLMRQKENYFEKIDISKSKYELRFDYEKGKHIIWDLLFLAEVAQKQMDDIALNELEKIISESNSYGVVKVSILNCYDLELEERLKRAVVIIQKIRDSLGHRVSLDEDFIPFEIIDNMAKIQNRHPNNHLNITLPVSYLKNFGSGIISMNQHLEIADEIDEYISNNLENDGIYNLATLFYRVEPSKLNELLEITADERGIQDVGKIPTIALNPKCTVTRFLTIKEMLKNNDGLLTINDLPNILFLCSDEDFRCVINYITDESGYIHFEWLDGISILCKCESEKRDNLVKLSLKRTGKKSGITYLKNLPASILMAVNNTERICEILCYLNNVPIVKTFDELPENIDISCLEHLPSVLFHNYCSLENFYYLYQKFPNDIKGIPEICFNCDLSRLKYLVEQIIKQGLNIRILNNAHMLIFKCDEERYNQILRYITKEDGNLDFSLFVKVPRILLMCPNTKIDMIFKLLLDGGKLQTERFEMLPEVLYSPKVSNANLTSLYNLLNTTNLISYEDLNSLSNNAFQVSPNRLSFIINKIRQLGLEISITKKLAYGFWNEKCSYERIVDIFNDMRGDYSFLSELPESLLYCSKEQYNYLTNLVRVNNKVDFSKFYNLPSIFYSYPIDVIDKLLVIYNYDISLFNGVSNSIFFLDDERQQILSDINRKNGIFKVEALQNLPEEFFSCPIENFKFLIEKANNDLTKLQGIPRVLFYAPLDCLKIFLKFVTKNEEIHFARLSELPFDFMGIDYDRLKFIYDRVGNNLATIKKLPKEIYTCEDSIAESMFDHFEANMMKSLFGINDSKLVALMLCLNETFSNFNNEGIDFLDLELSSLNISTAPEDVMNYVNKLNKKSDKSVDTGSLQWIEGVIQNFNNVRVKGSGSLNSLVSTATVLKGRLQDSNNMFERLSLMNKKLVSCLRNASEHLRIYPTDDSDTVRIMDYKYDLSYGMAEKVVSLDCEVKIDDLLEIVNQIEIKLNGNNRNPVDQEYIKDKKDFLFGELAHRLNCASNFTDDFVWSKDSLQKLVEGNFYLATQHLVDKYITYIIGLLSSEGISQYVIEEVLTNREIDIISLKQSIESNLCPLQEHLNISGFITSLNQLGNSIMIECRERNPERFTR